MANPAPTINQINAFNATQGTTIDFNIIGGTELVRSNRIYIYDLSDNSLICTHLYVSTESIHELPANTDSSIVYESGKSSADFVNGAQYYAQIQTYTDTAGTEGGSGLSVAKMFWCLVDPTLTITTIPSTISTTSYNVSATYTDTSASVVSNIIQQYQFNLYSAVGSLLQSSGVVVGSGTQQGTSDVYDISYNFTGLNVGSSYYVTVEVTTTQGMGVNAQSNTFTVSIDTPTLGEAIVVNNACDGYISVTSNLSGEYGGSASGEIATFVTDSVNDVSSLKVTLTPQQDGTPWIGTTHDTTPYLHRAMPTQSNDYNRESGVIVGGTVGWNQLVLDANRNYSNAVETDTRTYLQFMIQSVSTNPVTVYYSKGNLPVGKWETVFNGASGGTGIRIKHNGSTSDLIFYRNNDINILANHKYLLSLNAKGVDVTTVGGTVIENLMLIDITAMFGPTIADYIYSLEQATIGAGVAWFKKLFPNDYYEYNAGQLMSVNASSHDTVGFNAWDEEWELGNIYESTGGNGSASDRIRSKNYIPIFPNTTYYIKGSAKTFYYDADKNYLGFQNSKTDTTFVTLENAHFMRFIRGGTTTYNNDICINLHWDGERDGEYEPYVKRSYALDSDLELRGIPKLDASNNLYYDGDEYKSDGTVTRKYGIVDLGTLNWSLYSSGVESPYFRASITNYLYSTTQSNFICAKYTPKAIGSTGSDIGIFITNTLDVRIRDTAYSNAATFKTAMSGVYLVYELATPTTETAQAYTNPQVVDPDGTEEYVTANYVPVGHDSTYSLVCPISGYDEVSAIIHGKNLFDTDSFVDLYTNYEYTDSGYRCRAINLLPNTAYTVSQRSERASALPIILVNKYSHVNEQGFLDCRLTEDSKTFTTDDTGNLYIGVLASTTTAQETSDRIEELKIQLELGSTATAYEPYQGQTYTANLPQTVYGGTVDLVSGEVVIDRAMVDIGTLNWSTPTASGRMSASAGAMPITSSTDLGNVISDTYATITARAWYDATATGISICGAGYGTDGNIGISDPNLAGKTSTEAKSYVTGIYAVYELATPLTYQLTPQQIQTLVGVNNVWSEQGDIELSYHIPITNLLVKRQDVDDVSGNWLTLYSQPITQASDMDFTFIDFLNQYGKTYKYALVPLLTQTQSGVEVEVEGGYTVSDEVQSIFDGVFIADSTGSQKCKANVGYGDVDMNQAVGTITPIGAKYPVVITNSKNQYHNGSIFGTIVPDDYYFNGNLSRIDMVNKRNELEQFLTNKRAKIIKDWNSNIWLVMIMENINCTFNNEYGMGIVNFTANWIEVGDPTNQQDLQATGLIDVGGV